MITAYNIVLFDAVTEALATEARERVDFLADDTTSDLAGYRYSIGVIHGLTMARQIAEDVRRKLTGE